MSFYIVSKICIGGNFLEDCFHGYSEQIISAIANESSITYNLIKLMPELQNLKYYNTKCHPKLK